MTGPGVRPNLPLGEEPWITDAPMMQITKISAGTLRPQRMLATVTAASFSFALVQLDVTIVNVALPHIATAIGAGTADLQWVVDAYTLSFAVLLLNAGFLADRFGARRICLAGLVLFAAASLACGLAPTAEWLIAARVTQGAGAAVMMPSSLALINHAVGSDRRSRAKAIGWWTAIGGAAMAAGPVIGGLLLGMGSWRAIFLVNLPVCLIGGMLIRAVEETSRKHDAHSIDLPGQIVSILALAALTAAVIEVRPLGFRHPFVWGTGALGLIAAIGFVVLELRSRAPMLPPHLFHHAGFTIAVIYGVIVNLTYYGMMFVLSLYLQQVMGYSPIATGLAYLPLTATFLIVNIVSGWWTGKAGSRQPMMVGALIDATGFGLLLALQPHASYWLMLPAFFLMPGGMGLGVPAMTTTVLGSVERNLSGIAAAVSTAARQTGGAMGVAIFGALAGDTPAQIISGLHVSAALAAFLLVLAALLAALQPRATTSPAHDR